MAKAKRIRWECPNGLHAGELGSTRPPRDATVRFCLPCSAESGRLVQRTAPALERQRNAKRSAADAKRQRNAERVREQEARAYIVTVLDYHGGEIELDVRELLKQAWQTKELRERREEWTKFPGRTPVPRLELRRGTDRSARRKANERHAGAPERARDNISARAHGYGGRIVMTVGPGTGREWLETVVIHEAAHSANPAGDWHGGAWISAYRSTVQEIYGVTVRHTGQAAWKLDEDIAAAIREAGR